MSVAPFDQLMLTFHRPLPPVDRREDRARDAGEEGAAAHLRKVSASAYREIVGTVETYAGSGVPFTSDAIRRAITQATEEQLKAAPNAIGAVFAQLCRAGILERTGGSAKATHVGARGRRLPLWVGTAKARGVDRG